MITEDHMIDNHICTAVLHTISESSHYLVEIHHLGVSFYIMENNKPKKFLCIDTAKRAAVMQGAIKAFQALDRTYEEVDFMNDFDGKSTKVTEDLVPLALKF